MYLFVNLWDSIVCCYRIHRPLFLIAVGARQSCAEGFDVPTQLGVNDNIPRCSLADGVSSIIFHCALSCLGSRMVCVRMF